MEEVKLVYLDPIIHIVIKSIFIIQLRYDLTLLYRLSRQCSKYILNIIKLFTQKAYTPKAKFIEDSYSLSWVLLLYHNMCYFLFKILSNYNFFFMDYKRFGWSQLSGKERFKLVYNHQFNFYELIAYLTQTHNFRRKKFSIRKLDLASWSYIKE